MKTILNNFVVFNQAYYTTPLMDRDTGMNKTVFVEVEEDSFDEALETAENKLRKLGYDLEEETIIDFASDDTYKVWDCCNHYLVDIFEVMQEREDFSIILLDGTIKNY